MSHARRLNVLHVTFDMRIGGTEQVIRNLIADNDHPDVAHRLFCIEEPLGPWAGDLIEKGVPVGAVGRRPGFDLRVLSRLRKTIQDAHVDIVHCHQYTPWAYGAVAAAGTRARVIFTEHGRFYPDRASPKRRFVNPVLDQLTDKITAISSATKDALVNFEYLKPSRISVIYNGIAGLESTPTAVAELRNKLRLPQQAPILGSVARFDPIKNHRLMLEAFYAVREKCPEAHLLLVGDGEQRVNIERWASELGIVDSIRLPGYITDPGTWLATMDVFLLSSDSEGTSMTLLEAMSLSKPCVVTDVGGNAEVVQDGVNGIVVERGDTSRFSDACTALTTSTEMRKELGAAGRKQFETRFSARVMQSHYLSMYKQFAVSE